MFGSETAPRCPRVRLSDHLDFVTSGGRGWAKYYSKEGNKFIRSLDVQMNEINDSQMIRVAPPNNAEADRTRVRTGDVLLTITGSLIGRVAPVTNVHAGAFVSQHVAILRTHGFRPEFLSWAISTQEGQRQIRKNQTGQVASFFGSVISFDARCKT
jgi:type I restriction enzyme, S subunit